MATDCNLLHLCALLGERCSLEAFLTLEACGVPHTKGGAADDFPFETSINPLGFSSSATSSLEPVADDVAECEPSAIFLELGARGSDFWLGGTIVRAFEVAGTELHAKHLRVRRLQRTSTVLRLPLQSNRSTLVGSSCCCCCCCALYCEP